MNFRVPDAVLIVLRYWFKQKQSYKITDERFPETIPGNFISTFM